MLKRVTFLVILFMQTTIVHGSEDWSLIKDKKGIQAYTQKVEDSDHKKFKGVGTVDASLDSIVYLMRDISVMNKWLHTCYDPIVVEEIDPATRLIHMKNETPFVVKDRDLVLIQRMIKVSDDRVIVELVGKPDSINKVDGLVRIPQFFGAWRLTNIGKDKTLVEYFGHIDPGGAIPSFVTNLLLVDTPYESIRKIQKQKLKNYQGSLEFLVSLDQAELEQTKALAVDK